MAEDKGAMTCSAAGKLGGAKRRDSGCDYKSLGAAGGKKTAERHGSEHYRAAGAKGGAITKAKYGDAFYKEIGNRGGARVKELIAKGKAALDGIE